MTTTTAISVAKDRQLDWLLGEVLGGGSEAAVRARPARATFPWLAAAIALFAAGAAVGVALVRDDDAAGDAGLATPQSPVPWRECHGPAALDDVPADVTALRCFDFDDAACARLATFTALEHLDLSGMDVDARGYATSLPITDAGVRALAPLTGLRSLSLATCHRVDGDGLRVLEAMPRLERLDLTYTGVRTAGVERLARMPSLRTLVLSHCMAFHGSALAAIATLPGLRRLELRACATVAAADALHLVRLTGLRHLDLRDCQGRFRGQTLQIPDADGDADAPAPPVQDGIGITDAVVVALAELELETLLLGGCRSLTDAIAAPLAAMTTLRALDLSNLPATSAEVLTRLPAQLDELHVDDNPQFTPAGLRQLPPLPRLRTLGIAGLTLDDATLRTLLSGRPLHTLALGGAEPPGKGGRVDAPAPFPTAAAARALAAMPTLTALDLRDATFVDRPLLAAIATLPALRTLDLTAPPGKPRLDRDDALRGLAPNRSVTKLNLTWNRLSPDALHALAALPLAELDLYGTELPRDAVAAAAAAWPGCSIRMPDGQRWRAP